MSSVLTKNYRKPNIFEMSLIGGGPWYVSCQRSYLSETVDEKQASQHPLYYQRVLNYLQRARLSLTYRSESTELLIEGQTFPNLRSESIDLFIEGQAFSNLRSESIELSIEGQASSGRVTWLLARRLRLPSECPTHDKQEDIERETTN